MSCLLFALPASCSATHRSALIAAPFLHLAPLHRKTCVRARRSCYPFVSSIGSKDPMSTGPLHIARTLFGVRASVCVAVPIDLSVFLLAAVYRPLITEGTPACEAGYLDGVWVQVGYPRAPWLAHTGGALSAHTVA